MRTIRPVDGGFQLQFIDSTVETCRVERVVRPSAIALRFGDLVTLELHADDEGTDLTLRTHPRDCNEWLDIHAGWLLRA